MGNQSYLSSRGQPWMTKKTIGRGRRAIQELGIRSPLKEAMFTKAEVRDLSSALGLPTWDKPSFACLASRFPYGEEITPEA